MSNEELMEPRYKVIAGYPLSPYDIGDVLVRNHRLRGGKNFFEKKGGSIHEKAPIHRLHLAAYPHLFKRLGWWEDRQESDMPEYVRFTIDKTFWKNIGFPVGRVMKSGESDNEDMRIVRGEERTYVPMSYLEPATEEEYKAQNPS